MTKLTRPIMRYHGGKFRLSDWIISHFPPHRVYVEPFGGAASVLMQKSRSQAEVYNDLDGDIVNVMRVLQDSGLRAQLTELITFTPYARTEFELAWEACDDPVERARRTLIRAEMGFGSAGATKGKTGFRIDTTRKSTVMDIWARIPEYIQSFSQRLQGVLIENRPALQILKTHDKPDTLFYVDPPYLPATRQRGSACYRHEMTSDDHVELLTALQELKGSVIVSGYAHELYESMLTGWHRFTKNTHAASYRGSAARTEVLWLSPDISALELFQEQAA